MEMKKELEMKKEIGGMLWDVIELLYKIEDVDLRDEIISIMAGTDRKILELKQLKK